MPEYRHNRQRDTVKIGMLSHSGLTYRTGSFELAVAVDGRWTSIVKQSSPAFWARCNRGVFSNFPSASAGRTPVLTLVMN